MTSCLTFSCPLTEQKEGATGLEVRQRALFDREEESPDGLLKGERRERLVLLVAEMIRQAATGRRPDAKEVRDEQDHG